MKCERSILLHNNITDLNYTNIIKSVAKATELFCERIVAVWMRVTILFYNL